MMEINNSSECKSRGGLILNTDVSVDASNTQKRIASPKMTLLRNLTAY